MYPISVKNFEHKFGQTFVVWRIWLKLKKMFSLKILTVLVFLTYKCLYAIFHCFFSKQDKSDPDYNERWNYKICKALPCIGNKECIVDDSIRPFKMCVPEEILRDLKIRLEGTRFEEPLENSKFNYGFNPKYLEKLINYWRTQYQWRKQEKEMNKYPQFKTRINGLDVHFLHVKPSLSEKSQMKVIPLLLIHGWPGSCADFFKLIPILTSIDSVHNYVFQVICPSIPGFGFSEAPRHEGFDARDAASTFLTLMDRLHISQFYVQGCDWGAVVASLMGRFYPSRVKGLHVNSCFSLPKSFDSFIKFVLMTICPFLVTSLEYRTIFPLKKKIRTLWEESGYFHMQATKPDTIGCAMADSPAGMAAYLIEKFSFTTNPDTLKLPDGGLTEKFTLDELLTMVTICWVNKNFTSSARFYKENAKHLLDSTYEKILLTVPVGVAVFPNEILMLPKMIMDQHMEDLVSYTPMSRGGHFVALEEPQLLARDVKNFVQLVEDR